MSSGNLESALSQYNNSLKKRSILLQRVLGVCRNLLVSSPLARNTLKYLKKRVSADSIDNFEFGYFPDNINLEELTEHITLSDLEKLGLCYTTLEYDGDHLQYPTPKSIFNQHNLVFPYFDHYGNMVALVGRTIQENNENIQKYKYSIGFERSLQIFGLEKAKPHILKHNQVILVEGQIDCISCHEKGYKNVVGLGGTAFTPYQFALLRRFTDRFVLCLDNDQPGKNAKRNILQTYAHLAFFSVLDFSKDFKDIDAYMKAGFSFNLEKNDRSQQKPE